MVLFACLVMFGTASISTLVLPYRLAIVPLLVVAGTALVLYVLFELDKRHQMAQLFHYRQIEALLSVHACLKVARPLPTLRGWAVSPDLAVVAIELIREHRPRCVVELGSGASTVVSGYSLRANGSGQVYALEHDQAFAREAARVLESHGLADLARVLYAPLQPVAIGKQVYFWYAASVLDELPFIDLLIVDGPPSAKGRPMVRYPALPLMFSKLRDGAFILVDDFLRSDETAIVARWLTEHEVEFVRSVPCEKGAAILRKA